MKVKNLIIKIQMADTVFSVINIYFTFINKNKILVFRNWNELS